MTRRGGLGGGLFPWSGDFRETAPQKPIWGPDPRITSTLNLSMVSYTRGSDSIANISPIHCAFSAMKCHCGAFHSLRCHPPAPAPTIRPIQRIAL